MADSSGNTTSSSGHREPWWQLRELHTLIAQYVQLIAPVATP